MRAKAIRAFAATAVLATVIGAHEATAQDPGTSIESGPSGVTRDESPTFAFSSSEQGSTFECRVSRPGGDGAWRPCTSPHTVDLDEGDWVFSVRATDAAGNVDPTPATRDFTVDKGAIDTNIDAGPAGKTRDATPSFTFGSNVPGSTFECKFEGEGSPVPDFTACQLPYVAPQLPDGRWTLRVRAVTPEKRVDPTPAARRFAVDATAPETEIAGGPAEGGSIGIRNPRFEYRSEPGAAFECRMDNRRKDDSDTVPWEPCAAGGYAARNLAGGRHTFEVRAIDSVGNEDQTPATRTFTISVCDPEVRFGLVEATSHCLTNTGTQDEPRWVSEGDVKLNGLVLPAPGETKVVLEGPTAAKPGGTVALSNARIDVAGVKVFEGAFKWDLPAGEAGQEKDVVRLDLSKSNQSLFGLKIKGSAALRIGRRGEEGKDYYSVLALSVALPEVIQAGPTPGSGAVTGDVAVAMNRNGVNLDGLKIKVEDAYIGKLGVEKLCLSFARSGATVVSPCEPPRIGPMIPGETNQGCRSDNKADRFDGNLRLRLPTPSETRLGVYGGMYDGRLSYAGAEADNLNLPLTPGVNLQRVAVGMCVYPPPFKIAGGVGVSLGPTIQGKQPIRIDGDFSYTDAYAGQPWKIAAGGRMSAFGQQMAHGYMAYQPTGLVDFGFGAQFAFPPASISGEVKGWAETKGGGRFNVDGNVKVCIDANACAQALAVVSNVGAAGCVTITAATVWVPAWSWSRGFHWVETKVNLTGGAGYTWATRKLDLLIGSCSMDKFRAQRPQRVVAARQSTDGFDVQGSPPATAVRLQGDGGPPRVKLVGPGNREIDTPDNGDGVLKEGDFALATNDEDDTTQVIIANPGQGHWTVVPDEGSPRVTAIEQAGTLPAPVAKGHVTGRGRNRTLEYAYMPVDGQRITFVERGRKTEQRLGVAAGGECPGDIGRSPDGQQMKCGKIRFSPGDGPAGTRQIMALVEQDGAPRAKPVEAARYRAPATAMPPKPRGLKLRRRGSKLVVTWRGSAGNAVRVNTIVASDDGRRRVFIKKARARRLVVPDVSTKFGARVSVRYMRLDGVESRAAKAKVSKQKPKQKKRRRR
jgi:hypothetical protein